MTMTLYELSFAYEADAVQLRMRITELREQARRTGTRSAGVHFVAVWPSWSRC